jgi:hypothetical protein
MQWKGEKKKLISIKIWAHFGTVRCRLKWKFVFCTFQISAFPEAYVSSLTFCFCSLDIAKSSEREIVETRLFHDTGSLEEGFGISVKGLLRWYAGYSQAEACTDGTKTNDSLQKLCLFNTRLLYPTARHTEGENRTLFQNSTHFENLEK